MWAGEEFELVKEEYKNFAKQLDYFEKEKLEGWLRTVSEQALIHLKKNLLIQIGKHQYQVNFSQEFRQIIDEAKHLDRMGYQVPKMIINIAFQEREYVNIIGRLQALMDEFNQAVNDLTEME